MRRKDPNSSASLISDASESCGDRRDVVDPSVIVRRGTGRVSSSSETGRRSSELLDPRSEPGALDLAKIDGAFFLNRKTTAPVKSANAKRPPTVEATTFDAGGEAG
jgi:hypothetical protein